MDQFPVGSPVIAGSAHQPDRGRILSGRYVQIGRPDPEKDSSALFEATHGSDADPGQWSYMSFGPFSDADDLKAWMESVDARSDPLYMTVRDVNVGTPLGVISFLNIQTHHRSIELGNIWYVPAVRRSVTNTETIYLLLQECFGSLGYRRVEWKCDSLNERSRTAAVRLGFRFEGVFRQHYIVKGRNRDTAWHAMLDSDWERLKTNYEKFLYDESNSASLNDMNGNGNLENE